MAVVALGAGALFAWSGGIELVIAGADAVRDKFTGVKTLKPQCRKAQTVAETVREVCRPPSSPTPHGRPLPPCPHFSPCVQVMRKIEAEVEDLSGQPPISVLGPLK